MITSPSPNPLWPGLLHVLSAVAVLCSTAAAQKPDFLRLETPLKTGFLADVPARWMVEDENPLEGWARACNQAWARQGASSGDAMFEADSRELLDRALRSGNVDVVPMYAYEWLMREAEVALAQRNELAGRPDPNILKLEPMAVVVEMTVSGKTGFTEFVIVSNAQKPVQNFQDLKSRRVLEHGGQWGDLVGHWLDWRVQLIEGIRDRKLWNRNGFQRVASAQQAVLAVYFGEADACVVTRAEYEMVLQHNPEGLRRRLSVFSEKKPEDNSGQFPGMLLVAPSSLETARKEEICRRVETVTRAFPTGSAWMKKTTAEELKPALKPLEDLMESVIMSRLAAQRQAAAAEAPPQKLSGQIGTLPAAPANGGRAP